MVSTFRPAVTADCIIDISHWNGSVDFAKAKDAGIRAVFIKATQGAHPQGRDPLYHEHAAGAADLLQAPYHFLTHEPAKAQFDEFNAVVQMHPGMLVMLDWEGDHIPADLVVELGQMTADATGRLPLLYTGRYQLQHPHPVLSQWPLMLAEFGNNPVCPPGWDQWLIHQYTDKGSVTGVQGHVDRSVFAGSADDLEAWWHGTKSVVVAKKVKKAPVAEASVTPVEKSPDPVVTDESPIERILTEAATEVIAAVEKVI